MGTLTVILVMLLTGPNGGSIQHVSSYVTDGTNVQDEVAVRSCKIAATELNKHRDHNKVWFICRQIRVFPQGTETID